MLKEQKSSVCSVANANTRVARKTFASLHNHLSARALNVTLTQTKKFTVELAALKLEESFSLNQFT